MSEERIRKVNCAIVKALTFHGNFIYPKYHIYEDNDGINITFKHASMVLSYSDTSDNIVIRPCSFAELRYLLDNTFSDLYSAEVTTVMLENFCCKFLKPSIKRAKV